MASNAEELKQCLKFTQNPRADILNKAKVTLMTGKYHGYRPWVTAPSLLLFTILLTPLVIIPPASLCLGSVDRNPLSQTRRGLEALHQPDFIGNSIPFFPRMNS